MRWGHELQGSERTRGTSGQLGRRSGVGGAGHLAIQYAKAMGFKVVAVDLDDRKVALAEQLGATLAINAERQFPVNKVVSFTGGVHGILVTADTSQAYDQAIRMLRRGGTCIMIGGSGKPISLTPFDMIIKGLSVRGSLIGNRQDLREALQLVAEGKVTPVTESLPLEHANQAITALRNRQVTGRMLLRTTGNT